MTNSRRWRRHFLVVFLGLSACVVLARGQTASESQNTHFDFSSYLAHVAAANSALRLNEAAEAKRWLSAAPGDHRQWEWRLLDSMSDSSERMLATGDWTPVKLEYSPSGDRLCVAASDGYARLYDAQSWTLIREFKTGNQAVYAARFDPTGAKLATCNRDGKIAVWSLDSGEQLWEQVHGGQGLADVAFHPGGGQLAFCSWYRGAVTVLGIVSTWDAQTGSKLWQADFGVKPIVSVRYNRDGSKLAVGTWDALVGIWEMATMGEPRILDFRDVANYSAIDDIRWNGDGTRIVAASKNGAPRVWNLADNQVEKDLRGQSAAVFCVEFAHDDAWLISGGSEGSIEAWDLGTGARLHRWHGHDNRVGSIALHPDGKTFATASADKTVRVWSLDAIQRFDANGQAKYVYGFALSNDGQLLASGGQLPEDITVWEVDSRRAIRTIAGLTGSINCLDFGPDRQLVGGNWSGDVLIWDAATGTELKRLEKGDQGGLQQCAFSRDGRWVAATTNKKLVAIWDARGGRLIQKIPMEHGCWGVDFSPRGDLLAVGDGRGSIHLFAVETWEAQGTLSGGGSQVNGLRFSPDGGMIASGCEDGSLFVFDVAGEKPLFSASGHSQRIWTVDFSRDGTRIATGGADKKVKIWDAEQGVSVLTLSDFAEPVYNIAFQVSSDDLLVNGTVVQSVYRVPTAK